LYLFGGRDANDNIIQEIDIYDYKAKSWTTSPTTFTQAPSDFAGYEIVFFFSFFHFVIFLKKKLIFLISFNRVGKELLCLEDTMLIITLSLQHTFLILQLQHFNIMLHKW